MFQKVLVARYLSSLPVFALVLGLLLAGLYSVRPQNLAGDADEYALTTIAFATHGTPDVRLEDIAIGRRLMPSHFSGALDALEEGMRTQQQWPKPGFYRGKDERIYAIHFFAYSALAAIPFKLLDWAGLHPLGCFQILNATMIFVLGLSLFHLFGSVPKSLLGVALFMLCGGVFYWDWSSPECLTATALLAGLILFLHGLPLVGALLMGLASLQNPPVIFSFVFASLLHLAMQYQAGDKALTVLHRAATLRYVLAVGFGLTLSILAPLFNYAKFGVPSILAVCCTNPALISIERLQSFYLDLNQGMVVGIPGVLVVLTCWSWWRRADFLGSTPRWQSTAVLACCIAMALCFAIPSMLTTNWNSGADGVMRYVFWTSMSFIFLLLWILSRLSNWPVFPLVLLLLIQVLATANVSRYSYVRFSPQAIWVMEHAPHWYNPEIEIFIERSQQEETAIDLTRTYAYGDAKGLHKTLFHKANLDIDPQLCGLGRALSPANTITSAAPMWRYINGPILCVDANTLEGGVTDALEIDPFTPGDALRLKDGWSGLERNDSKEWTGVWSDGKQSILTIRLNPNHQPTRMVIIGHYFGGSRKTHVQINGQDYGWRQLEKNPLFELNGHPGSELTILLTHDTPHQPSSGSSETRQIAFFLNRIVLR